MLILTWNDEALSKSELFVNVHYSLGDPDNSAQPGSKVALKTSANFNQQVHGSLITQPGPS